MLIEFSVGNFLSFNKKRTINFKAKGISELKNNVVSCNGFKLLRSAVIYGANSSGKSNLIKAFDRMRDTILSSVKLNDSDELDYTPFLLSKESEKQPTFFEIVFLDSDQLYRYGFEYNSHQIVSEWLFIGKTENPLFIRTIDGIGVLDKFEEGKGKEHSTNNNRLFLSLVAQLGGSLSKKVIELVRNYNVLSGIDHRDYYGFTAKMLQNKLEGCEKSLDLYKTLKLGFKDLKIAEAEFNPRELPDEIPNSVKLKLIKELTGKIKVTLEAIHNKYDRKKNVVDTVSWDIQGHESDGTNKIIDLSGPIFDTLFFGKVLIIDELDAKLHPLITMHIVSIFNDPKTNPNCAQLLFATHDTNLLSSDLFRRDQIWFAEKDDLEQTDLYSLYNIQMPDGSKVRSDSNLEKNYIRGRYGAIPFIVN